MFLHLLPKQNPYAMYKAIYLILLSFPFQAELKSQNLRQTEKEEIFKEILTFNDETEHTYDFSIHSEKKNVVCLKYFPSNHDEVIKIHYIINLERPLKNWFEVKTWNPYGYHLKIKKTDSKFQSTFRLLESVLKENYSEIRSVFDNQLAVVDSEKGRESIEKSLKIIDKLLRFGCGSI